VKLQGAAFWLAVAGVSVLSLVGLNMAADNLPFTGLREVRDYTVRRNG
jgi:hypothetical protein